MPTIVCPQCRTENRPAGLSALDCEQCDRSIDPRVLGVSPGKFVQRQRKLRTKTETGPLGPEEADDLTAWILDLPPDGPPAVDDTAPDRRTTPLLVAVRRWRAAVSGRRPEVLYADDVVRMRNDVVVINRYYWPLGRKRIRYSRIREFTARPLKAWHGQYRVHGIDHLGRWYSRDRHRGEKEMAIDLTVGRLIKPVLTPDDVDTVLQILDARVSTDGH